MRYAWLVLTAAACGRSSPAVVQRPPPAPPPSAPVHAAPAKPPQSPYPSTERRPVTDSYGDLKVVDDYRWLEDAKSRTVIAWTAAQNQLTRSRLDALPDRGKIHARVAQLLSSTAPEYLEVRVVGGGVLAIERRPPKQQALLVELADPAKPETERVVLDPNELDPSGKTAIDFFVVSRDGKRVGISLSKGGSETGDVHIYDVATGKPLDDVVPRVNGGTAGGSIAWNAEGTGFWYTRYPREGERPAADLGFYQQVYFHKLGTPTTGDTYVLGEDLPRIAEIQLRSSPDHRTVLAIVANGDGGEFALYAIASHGSAGARSTPGGSAESIASHGSAGARSTPGGSAESIASHGSAGARSTPGGSAESIASHGSAGARSTPGGSAESIASHGSAGARSTPGGSAESSASHGSAGARSTPGGSAESSASHGSAGARSTPGGSAESIEPRGTAQLFKFSDKIIDGRFGPDGALYLISRRGAPRGQVVRLARPYASSRPDVIVPEGDGVIEDLAATATRLYVVEQLGGPSRLRSFRLARGKASAPEVVATPYPVAAIDSPRAIGTDDLLYRTQSYTTTPGWFRLNARTRQSVPTALVQPMAFSMDDVEVVRETCTSADGTAVPISILRKRGIALDGSNPALLYGYGGYSSSLTPSLHRLTRMWIDQGGVYAEANLRGGNEFGEVWHEGGRLTHKQNVFDDFYACERALVDKGYTRPELLAIEGRSNGGLLMGAALVQHPEMVRAVVSGVGIYDMLRVELTPNGAFNVTEYGTVKDPAQLAALHAYSPYHHVVSGAAYPAVLLTTGANDPRVDPYNSRKMAARLQAASSSVRPILLRASDDVGHGMGSPLAAVIDEATDSFAFIMNELGMHYTE